MSDWRDDGPLLGWTYETQGESTAYCWGAAVAFGFMGMAEAIRERLAEAEWLAAEASSDLVNERIRRASDDRSKADG